MKKFLISVLAASLMLAGADAFAQTSASGLSVGAGWANTTWRTKLNGSTHKTTGNGFYLGAFYEIPVNYSGFSIEPGLYWEFLSSGGHDSLKEHYLSIPVMAKLSYNLADDTRFFAFAGPTFQLGLSSETGDINNYDHDWRRSDVLLGGGVGFDLLDVLRIKVGVNWGLGNHYDGDGIKIHRNEVTLGVAYLF